MHKRLFISTILILLAVFINGCWSRREIEKLAIATLISYDKVTVKGQEKWLIGARIIRPAALGGKGPLTDGSGDGGGAANSAMLISGMGDTIWEAGRDLSTRMPRREYFAHVNIIILGERVARDGLDKMVDNFLRSKDIRLNTNVLVTKGKAIDVLRAEPELEELLSQEILGLLQENQPAVSKAFTIDIKRFLNYLLTPGQDAVASYIEIFYPEDETSNEQEGKVPESGGNNRKLALRLHGAAVFRKNRLVGWLNDSETKGYLYAMSKAKQGMISLKLHQTARRDVVFSMTRAKSKITPNIKNGQIAFHIKIRAEGDLQQHEDTMPIANPEDIKAIEQVTSREIKNMVENAVNAAKDRLKADIFGFGDRLHKKYPKVWREVEKDWGDIYPDVKVIVNVDAKIRRTGMITDTPVTIQ